MNDAAPATTWHKANAPGRVLLRARVDGDTLADLADEVLPGETAAGLDYDAWRALPDGPVSIRLGDRPEVRPLAD